jgi:hypothetical protein
MEPGNGADLALLSRLPLWGCCMVWHEVKRVVETPNLFLIYPNPIACRILPKRAFPNPADAAEFRRVAMERMGADASRSIASEVEQ